VNRPKNFVCKGFLQSDEVLLASVPAPQGTGDFVPRAATATIVSTPHADGPKQRSQGIGTEPSSSMLASARNVHPKMIMVPEEVRLLILLRRMLGANPIIHSMGDHDAQRVGLEALC
jgi:hypothetical protein